jgi:hypothetical protein
VHTFTVGQTNKHDAIVVHIPKTKSITKNTKNKLKNAYLASAVRECVLHLPPKWNELNDPVVFPMVSILQAPHPLWRCPIQ